MKTSKKTKLALAILLMCLLPGFLPGTQAQDEITTKNRGDIIMINELVKYYDEYVAECKADTFSIEYHVYNNFGKERLVRVGTGYDLDPGFSPGYKGIEKRQHHRVITFEGFMEYLRKRGKNSG